MRSNWLMGAAGALLALVVVALLGATTALSRPRHGGCHGHGSGARLERLEAKLAELELDAETRAAAAQLIAQAREESEKHREEMKEARRAMRELLEQEEPALESVLAQADAIGVLETAAHKAKLRNMLELRSLLGPEQWETLKGALRRGRGKKTEDS